MSILNCRNEQVLKAGISAFYDHFFWTSANRTTIIPIRFRNHITVGNDSMSQDYTDRRRHQRIEVAWAIFIEVVDRGSRSESENTIIRCETVDVSAGGLRVHVPQAIAQGSQLNITVPMEDWKENLELVGEAMWARPVEDGKGFWVGLELRDSSRQNMERWCKVVHSLSGKLPA